MNLIEAVESGKPFRRPDWKAGVEVKMESDGRLRFLPDGVACPPSREEITADDWEISLGATCVVNARGLWSALQTAFRHEDYRTRRVEQPSNREIAWRIGFHEVLCKELGLPP